MKNTTKEIRSTFLNFFEKNGHKPISASSLIPYNDPTMMFVNSGMVQFKNVFTGLETRDYTRATSCQKSVRAGGKHNDLENVGYTARHHTFFEMLGNFSFGDYFKEDAIKYAWDLLTKEYQIPKDKLYVTVYHTDEEAELVWKKVANLSSDRIIKIDTNDNFWSMGDTGPCGPCSEIFFDHGDHIPGGLPGTPEQDGDRFIEIWNMVFMQFEQKDKDTRVPLPKKSIDTGMGLERITAVLQNVHDNYDIDLFREIIETSESLTSTKAQGDRIFSHRVIADHLRSSAFLIADGVMPSNEGRGYVLRRIMRRSMRHAHILGAKEPLLYRMLPKLVSLMGESYPELARAESFVAEVLKSEEEKFRTTLDRGLKLLDEEAEAIKGGETLSGGVAFKLYDTYGFPLDLTQDILKNRKIDVDTQKFDELMLEQKERARKAWSGSGESKFDEVWFEIQQKFGSTEFLGYSLDISQAIIQTIVKDGAQILSAKAGEQVSIITNQTPFYGESGGQMGDIGYIETKLAKLKVLDTKKYLGSIISHICLVESGEVKVDDVVDLAIDTEYRAELRRAHSATHLLHKSLRDLLGSHVTQKGSLVSAGRLRLDVSHMKAISKEELSSIELEVNKMMLQNDEVHTKLMNVDDAIKNGAMALFGEKYDDEVRVVSMGSGTKEIHYSVELCGGTHVRRLGDIGLFKIVSESAISAGVRRIEAVCGMEALRQFNETQDNISSLADMLKISRQEIGSKVSELLENKKSLENQIMKLKEKTSQITKEEVGAGAVQIGQVTLYVKKLDDIDSKIQRSVAENITKQIPNLVLVSLSDNGGKISIVVSCGDEAQALSPASEIAKFTSLMLGGAGGGGSSKLAQSGGVVLLEDKEIILKLKEFIPTLA